jgi:hypothetical protein
LFIWVPSASPVGGKKLVLKWLGSNYVLVAWPFLFWIFKLSLGAPEGFAAGYNDFIFNTGNGFVLKWLAEMWDGIAYGFLWPLVAPLNILDRRIFAAIFLVTLLALFLLVKYLVGRTGESSRDNEKDNKKILPSISWLFNLRFRFLTLSATRMFWFSR